MKVFLIRIKKRRCFIAAVVLLTVVNIVIMCLHLTQSHCEPKFEKYEVGGTEGSAKDQAHRTIDFCESPPSFNPQPLEEPLGAHFAVATQEGLLVGGGISGLENSNHTARSVYLLAYNSSTWVAYPHLQRPRIQSCVRIEGSKIFVTGGTSEGAEMPCKLSTEMLDLDQLEDGWQLTDYIYVADGFLDPSHHIAFSHFLI